MEIKNTSNLDADKYEYLEYGIGFDSKGSLTHTSGEWGGEYDINAIIFGANLSNSKHANKKTKNVLVLCQDFIQKIVDIAIYAEKMYSPNFTVSNKTICLNLHYNGDNRYLFVNGKQVVNFKS